MTRSLVALLPVRLETRFLPPGHRAESPEEQSADAPQTWRLRLRIVPDTISLDRHDPAVTAAEKLGVAALWRALRTAPDPTDPLASARDAADDEAWPDALARLSAQVGAGRAAWLIRSLPVRREGEGPSAVVEVGDAVAAAGPREGVAGVRAFPGEIDVWVRWAGEAETDVLHTLRVDTALLEATGMVVAPWLVEWDAGVAAGMAAEIDLPRHPEAIEVLGVSGWREEDGNEAGEGALASLFGAHAAAGALSLTGPGRATTIVHGAPVLPSGRGPDEWFAVPGRLPPHARRTLDALLGAGAADIGPVRAFEDDGFDAELVRLTFPALWGYGLAGVLRLVEPIELSRLWRWANTWFRPQGSYATLVVDGTAYGVLPVVDAGRLVAGTRLAPVAELLPALGRAVGAWEAAANADPGAVGGGVGDVVRVLRRGPVPVQFAHATYLPTDLVAALTHADPWEAREAWDERHAAAREVLDPGRFRGRRYWARTPATRRMGIPVIVGHEPSPEEAAQALADTLERWRDEYLFEEVDLGNGAVRAVYVHPEIPDSSWMLERTHPESLLARLFIRSTAVAGAVLDLLRQREGPGLDPGWGDEPAHELVESLVLRGNSTRTRHHLNALAHVLRDAGLDGSWAQADPELVEELTWLTSTGLDLVRDLTWACASEPHLSRVAHRAFGAVLEAAAGRWDPWWDAVGAAHVADVHAADPGAAAAGVYGWVDTPWRGRAGPGPGGLLMAPSLAQAATAAALRDRAVHDAEARWDLRLDSATIGPARSMLRDIADGWHPAEVVGRLVERELVANAADAGVALGSEGLKALRAAFPLRTGSPVGAGAGLFGCCHGFHVLAAPAADLPPVPGAPNAVRDAVAVVGDVVGAAADLLLAESVHGVLAGRPERAAVATEFLAGQLAPGPLSVLDAERPGRAVHTLVLAAFPPATPGAAGALAAAPGFDTAVRMAAPDASWAVTLRWPVEDVVVAFDELGLAPVHAAILEDDALHTLATLHAGMTGRDASDAEGSTPPEGAATVRRLAAAFTGRAPDPAELAPPSGGRTDGNEADAIVAARAEAVAGWRERTERLADVADALADAVARAAEGAGAAWGAARERERAERDEEDPPDEPIEPGPSPSDLAGHLLALAAWGISPSVEVRQLFSPDEGAQTEALVATLEGLAHGAGVLRARAAAGRVALAHGTVGATTLAELGAGRSLPLGTPAPADVLGEPLADATGSATLTDWLPAVASVRRALAPLPALLTDGMTACAAVAPDDPWRQAALAPPAPDATLEERLRPDPRLTVVVGTDPAAGGTREFVLLDAFAEQVPDPEPSLGLAFDAATPSSAPPQAVLLVPAPDPAIPLQRSDLPSHVLRGRAMAHARMATTETLARAGLGPLAATCMLPQDGDTGCPLDDPHKLPRFDQPAALVPVTGHEDTADVVGAVTADASWMLGVQWRLGEHVGENAASPVRVDAVTVEEELGVLALAHEPAESEVERAGWRSDEMFHSATWASMDPATPGRLEVRRHDAGPLDWWALMRDGAPPAGGGVERESPNLIPGRLRWPGQPRRRYWQVDDAASDPVGKGPDRAHPASLHFVDVVSRLGDDWYRVPLAARPGALVSLVSARLVDSAGGSWTLRTDPRWSLFAVAGADPDPGGGADAFHRALPVLLSGLALEGEPTEEVALAIDEDENLLWAAVLRVDGVPEAAQGTDGGRAAGHIPGLPPRASAPVADPMGVDWSLGGTPPRNRVPYLYGELVREGAFGHGEDLFVQARIRDPRTGTLTDPPSVTLLQAADRGAVGAAAPHVLRPLAVPASGVRLVRRPVLARDTHGRPVRWMRSERRPLDVAVDVDMAWDLLTPRAPEDDAAEAGAT